MAVDKKTLSVLFSLLNTALIALSLMLQLYGLTLIQFIQQQRRLNYLRDEAISSQNAALSRYRRAEIR